VNRLKDEVFKGTSYVVTSIDTNSPYAALILGNSRSNDTAATYQEVMMRFEAIPDLASKLDLLYTPYPSEFLQGFTEDSDPLSVEFFGGSEPEKAWMVVPKSVTQLPPKWGFGPQFFAAGSLGVTALSCMVCALGAYALNPAFVARVEAGDTATVNEVIPLFTALLGLNVRVHAQSRASYSLFFILYSLFFFGALPLHVCLTCYSLRSYNRKLLPHSFFPRIHFSIL
jgi:hypothetical protein